MSVSYVFGSSLSVLVSSVSEHTHVPRRPCFATKMSISLFVSVFSVSLSVWPTDRVVSGWWWPVHRATTMNLYCGITDPARSLTMGNELLRPGADPLPFERGVETDDTSLQFLTFTMTTATSYNSFKPRSVTTCYNNAQIWHFGYIC